MAVAELIARGSRRRATASLRIASLGTVSFVTLALLSACSAPSSNPAGAGQFTANLTGAVTTTLSGFATSSGRAGTTWTLTMIVPGGPENISMITEDGLGRLDPGTYNLVDATTGFGGGAPSPHLIAALQLAPGAFTGYQGFNVMRGTLTVSASTATSVSGSFEFVTSHSSDPSSTVTVSGTFTSANEEL